MSPPWSSELAAGLHRDRDEMLATFVILRAQPRDAGPEEFVGGEDERSRLLRETEQDYVAICFRRCGDCPSRPLGALFCFARVDYMLVRTELITRVDSTSGKAARLARCPGA